MVWYGSHVLWIPGRTPRGALAVGAAGAEGARAPATSDGVDDEQERTIAAPLRSSVTSIDLGRTPAECACSTKRFAAPRVRREVSNLWKYELTCDLSASSIIVLLSVLPDAVDGEILLDIDDDTLEDIALNRTEVRGLHRRKEKDSAQVSEVYRGGWSVGTLRRRMAF